MEKNIFILKGIKKVVAHRLLKSKQEIPHVYFNISVEVDSCINLKNELKEKNINISINDFIIAATARALKEYPQFNAHFLGEEHSVYKNINIGFAVAAPQGLIVPVIENTDFYGLSDLSVVTKRIIEKTFSGKLRPKEFLDGTFSISNIGKYGINQFYPIINPPQVGILGIGSIESKPKFLKGNLTECKVVNISLSADHRAISGTESAEFLSKIKNILENSHNEFKI